MRTSARHASWLLVRDGTSACNAGACNDYLTYTNDRSSLAVGAHVKLGLLVRPYKNLSFGLSLTAPSLHLFGSAKESATITRADGNGYAAIPTRATGSSEVGLPARAALGFAYVKRRYTFSADVSINFAHSVRLAFGMVPQAINGLGAPAAVPDLRISPGVQPNLNLGASVPFGATKEVNIGFFTDLSSVSEEDVKRLGMSRVHMFGGSMTLGLLGKQSRAWIGVSGEIGHTTTKVPGRDFTYEKVSALPPGTLPSEGDATVVRWTMTGILGSNYSFLE
jgi:hypothetical protein